MLSSFRDNTSTWVAASLIIGGVLTWAFVHQSQTPQEPVEYPEPPHDATYVDIDDHSIRYIDTRAPTNATSNSGDSSGTASSITLVLVHGFAGCLETWNRLIPNLLDVPNPKFRVVAMDLIGSGFSDKPLDYDYSFRSQGRFVAQVVMKLHLSNVVLVGHSSGAIVAMAAATQLFLETPSKVRGLYLIAPGFLNQKPALLTYRPLLPLARWLARSFVNILPKTFQACHSSPDKVPIDIQEAFEACRKSRGFLSALEACVVASEDPYIDLLTKEFPLGKIPIHMLWSDKDKVNPYAKEKIIELIGGGDDDDVDKVKCTYELIEGSGHYVQHELPEELASSIARFSHATC